MAVKIAQITDTHLFPDRDTVKRGVATWHSLRAIVDRVRDEQPDAIVLSGDLAHDGDPDAYDLLYELIAPLGVPVYWIPGNHDRLDIARSRLDRAPFERADRVAIGGWNLLLLDSTFPDAQYGEGKLSGRTLALLDILLDPRSNGDRPVAIALHHHPLPMGIDWLDTIAVTNAADLTTRLDRAAHVKLVMFGHTHLEFAGSASDADGADGDRDEIRYYGTPSTCTQVLRDDDNTPADSPLRHPGFRLFELHDDGSHTSRVVRVAEALAHS